MTVSDVPIGAVFRVLNLPMRYRRTGVADSARYVPAVFVDAAPPSDRAPFGQRAGTRALMHPAWEATLTSPGDEPQDEKEKEKENEDPTQ